MPNKIALDRVDEILERAFAKHGINPALEVAGLDWLTISNHSAILHTAAIDP
jgi:hypothetical protein